MHCSMMLRNFCCQNSYAWSKSMAIIGSQLIASSRSQAFEKSAKAYLQIGLEVLGWNSLKVFYNLRCSNSEVSVHDHLSVLTWWCIYYCQSTTNFVFIVYGCVSGIYYSTYTVATWYHAALILIIASSSNYSPSSFNNKLHSNYSPDLLIIIWI